VSEQEYSTNSHRDPTTETQITVLEVPGERLKTTDPSPDGRHIVTTSTQVPGVQAQSNAPSQESEVAGVRPGFNVRLWEACKGELLAFLHGHAAQVNTERFSGDGRYIITSSADGIAKIHPAIAEELLRLGCRLLQEQPGIDRIQPLCGSN
jgi:WD40 repeat protein